MDVTRFAPVDFSTPMFLAVGVPLFVLPGVALLIHARYRRRRFARDAPGYQTFSRRRGIQVELWIGAGCVILAALLGALAAVGYQRAWQHLAANIQLKYQPLQLEPRYWNGSWAVVDLTLPDGTRMRDARVTVSPAGEPRVEGLGDAADHDGVR